MPKFNPFGNQSNIIKKLLEELARDGKGPSLKNKFKNIEQSTYIRNVDRIPAPKQGNDGDTVLYMRGNSPILYVKAKGKWWGTNLTPNESLTQSATTTSASSAETQNTYDSGWFSVKNSSDNTAFVNSEEEQKGRYIFHHNLNCFLVNCNVFCRFEGLKNGSVETYVVNLSSHISHSGSNMNHYGYWINLLDEQSLELNMHPDGVSILYSELLSDGTNNVSLLGSKDSTNEAAIELRLIAQRLADVHGASQDREYVRSKEKKNQFSDNSKISTGKHVVGNLGAIKEGTKNDTMYLGESDTILLNNSSGSLNITNSAGAAVDVNIGGGALYDSGTGKISSAADANINVTNSAPTAVSDFATYKLWIEKDAGKLWYLSNDESEIFYHTHDGGTSLTFALNTFTQTFDPSVTTLIGPSGNNWVAAGNMGFVAGYSNEPAGMTVEVSLSGASSGWSSVVLIDPIDGEEASTENVKYPSGITGSIVFTCTCKNSGGSTIGTRTSTYNFSNTVRYGNSAQSIGNQNTSTINALSELGGPTEDITRTWTNFSTTSGYMVIAYPDRLSDSINQVQGDFGEGYITCSFNSTATTLAPQVQSSIADVANSKGRQEGFACITSRLTGLANGSNDFKTLTSSTVQNYVFWGVSETASSFDATDVLGTASEADHHVQTGTNNTSFSFSITAEASEYIIFAVPNRAPYAGDPTFTVGGFDGGFNDATGNIAVTTEGGYTENYKLYRSDNVNLGTTTVTVAF